MDLDHLTILTLFTYTFLLMWQNKGWRLLWSDVLCGQEHICACTAPNTHTHCWHMRKGSSSGVEVRESPVFVYQRGGGGREGANLIPRSVQLKHALMPLLLLQDFLSLCFSLTLYARFSVCACISVELWGGQGWRQATRKSSTRKLERTPLKH